MIPTGGYGQATPGSTSTATITAIATRHKNVDSAQGGIEVKCLLTIYDAEAQRPSWLPQTLVASENEVGRLADCSNCLNQTVQPEIVEQTVLNVHRKKQEDEVGHSIVAVIIPGITTFIRVVNGVR